MKMLRIIEKRHSVRDFRDKALNADDLASVDQYINSLPQISDDVTVTLTKIEDAEECYRHLDGHAGYNGVMIKAPYYVIVSATKNPNGIKAGGYAGEWFILNLTRHNIGTCWISANHSEKRVGEYINLPADQEVVAIIAYGYPESEARVSNIFGNREGNITKVESSYSEAPVSSRMSLEKIVHINQWGNLASLERLEELGYDDVFYYMRLAPSSVNRQPWRFLIKGGNFVLCISREDGYDNDHLARLEAGIAMLYFEVAMHDSGLPGKWYFEELDKDYQTPDEYLVAAVYRFN